MGNAPAALRNQVFDELVSAEVVVSHHAAHVGQVRHTVKKYQRNASATHVLEITSRIGYAW